MGVLKVVSSVAVDQELWLKFKSKVALKGKYLSEVMEELIKQYVEEDGES